MRMGCPVCNQRGERRAESGEVILSALRSTLSVLIALCALACHREVRNLAATGAEAQRTVRPASLKNPYEGNAYAIGQGQQLFEQYNCSGCHAHGGGSIGPPLMDDEWIYGSSPAKIYETISVGRPNGMPAWGGRIPEYQIWQLVTYVRSLSNLEPQNVTPARAEEMQAKKAEE